MLCQINQDILKAPKNNCNKWKAFQPMCQWDLLLRAYYSLFYLQFCDSNDQWKNTVARVLLAVWEIFLHENNHNYNSCRYSYKFAFILVLPFLTNQKQESDFQQVGGLVARNISAFCLYRVVFYFQTMPNSIDFYKGIFFMLGEVTL